MTSRSKRSGEHRGNVRLRAALPEVLGTWAEQGTRNDTVLREYQALREALWRFLERSVERPDDSLPAILRIDVAISVATTAALRGYHRADSEPAASWEPPLLRHIHDASERLAGGLDGQADKSAEAW